MAMLRPASKMKNSGIEWVGQIPSNWRVVKNNRLFRITKTLVDDAWETTQLLSLTKGGIIEKDINDGSGKQPESFSTYQFVQKDDIVLCLFDIDVSAVFSDRSSFNGMISPAYRVMKCEKNILPVYAKWWFDAVNVGRYYLIYTKSLRKTIDSEGFGNILTVIPPLSEQQTIADYLDDRCSKIDKIIAEATASIEEYKELKQAVIFEAVTKGLDKNVPMKDSGVYCLGMIPSEWGTCKTKYLVRVENGSDPVSDGDVPVYGSGANSFKTCGEYKVGPTVLLGRKGATLHIPHYITGLYWNVDTAFNTVPVSEKINLKYFYYAAICFDYKAYISQTTLPGMTQTSYRNMKIALPNVEVQNDIVNYLDNKVSEIDSLISEKQALIDDLQAYKKSLIYEVVTGKRRVV
ncbi:MAG: restriction endonuclease subunit S [Aeriscardovia sp.]|nr:restriction endonuclease subunit S [Aeriscardovia sp.]